MSDRALLRWLALAPNVTKLQLTNCKLVTDKLLDALPTVLPRLTHLVLDGTDNFSTRFQINDACVAARKCLITGAAIRLEGQVTEFGPDYSESPCYRCLYEDASDDQLNCAEAGIAAPVVGTIGTLQALEALKLIVGIGESLAGYVLTFDARYMDWRKLKLPQREDCPSCQAYRKG